MLKVYENVAPFPRSPESQSPLGAHEEPEVQVCPFSFQVHCTVSPGWIVTDEGEKESSPFPTVTMTVAALPALNDRPRATAIVSTAVILRNEELFMISFVDSFWPSLTANSFGVISGRSQKYCAKDGVLLRGKFGCAT